MSGVCGVFSIGKDAPPVDKADLRVMSGAIKQRGLEGEHIHVAENGAFGLARRGNGTCEYDPAGSQPACDASRQVWVVSDGPIYNFKELSERVSKKTSVPPPQTQGELIAELFRLEGERAFRMIDGECAFALIDTSVRRLYLVRDAGGLRGLYYALKGDRCIFAGRPKALLADSSVGRDLDEQALCDYLTFLYTPPPRTILKGIRKLSPAEFVCIDVSGCRRQKYWNPLETGSIAGRDQAYYVDVFRERLEKAVKKRSGSPGELAVFMGGIDSAALAGMAAGVVPGGIHTVTGDMQLPGGFDAEQDDLVDLQYGRETAKMLGATHHEFVLDRKDLARDIAFEVDSSLDDLMAPHLIFPATAARIARENGARVAFVGEPALQYSAGVIPVVIKHLAEKWWPRRRLPGIVKRIMAWTADRAVLRNEPDDIVFIFRREFWRNLGKGYPVYWIHKPGIVGKAKRKVLAEDVWRRCADPESVGRIRQLHSDISRHRPDASVYDYVYFTDLMNVTDHDLRFWETACAANDVEFRAPYLDRELVEFGFATPYSVKALESKFLIAKSMKGILPDEIVYREKAGAAVATNAWVMLAMPGILRQVMREAAPGLLALFRRPELERIIKLHEEGHYNLQYQLLPLIGLFLWHRRWVEGKSDIGDLLADCFSD